MWEPRRAAKALWNALGLERRQQTTHARLGDGGQCDQNRLQNLSAQVFDEARVLMTAAVEVLLLDSVNGTRASWTTL
jgi:hypothetical protein